MSHNFAQTSFLIMALSVFAQVFIAVGFATTSSLRFIHPLRKVILAIGMIIFSQSLIWNTVYFAGQIWFSYHNWNTIILNIWLLLIWSQVAFAMAAGTFILADCQVANHKVDINPDGYSGRLIRKLGIKRSADETYDICRISWEIANNIVWARISLFPLKYTYKALAFAIRPIYRFLRQVYIEKELDYYLRILQNDIPWTPVTLAMLLGATYLVWGRHGHIIWFSILSATIVTLWVLFHFAPLFVYRCTDRISDLFFIKPGSRAKHALTKVGNVLKPLGKAAKIGYTNVSVLFALAKRIKRGTCPIVNIG